MVIYVYEFSKAVIVGFVDSTNPDDERIRCMVFSKQHRFVSDL